MPKHSTVENVKPVNAAPDVVASSYKRRIPTIRPIPRDAFPALALDVLIASITPLSSSLPLISPPPNSTTIWHRGYFDQDHLDARTTFA